MNMENFIEYNSLVPPEDKYEISDEERQRRIEDLESEIDGLENGTYEELEDDKYGWVNKNDLKKLTDEYHELLKD